MQAGIAPADQKDLLEKGYRRLEEIRETDIDPDAWIGMDAAIRPNHLSSTRWLEKPVEKTKIRSLALRSPAELEGWLPDWPVEYEAEVVVNRDEHLEVHVRDCEGNSMSAKFKREPYDDGVVLLGFGTPNFNSTGLDTKEEIKRKLREWLRNRIKPYLARRGFRLWRLFLIDGYLFFRSLGFSDDPEFGPPYMALELNNNPTGGEKQNDKNNHPGKGTGGIH